MMKNDIKEKKTNKPDLLSSLTVSDIKVKKKNRTDHCTHTVVCLYCVHNYS